MSRYSPCRGTVRESIFNTNLNNKLHFSPIYDASSDIMTDETGLACNEAMLLYGEHEITATGYTKLKQNITILKKSCSDGRMDTVGVQAVIIDHTYFLWTETSWSCREGGECRNLIGDDGNTKFENFLFQK